MKRWTYLEAREKLEADTDLESYLPLDAFSDDDDFVDADEMAGYFNEAIDEAEAEIHKLGVEDEYFLDEEYLDLVEGTSEYDMPDTIYANKIRNIIYKSGSLIYPVKRFRHPVNKFMEIEYSKTFGTTEDYRYYIRHRSASDGYKIIFSPTIRETSGTVMKMYFIRNANRVELPSAVSQAISDATIIDIPEFINFIFQFVKCRIMEKEKGDPNYMVALQILQAQRKLMVDTLTQQVPDEDDMIMQDQSIYEEHS